MTNSSYAKTSKRGPPAPPRRPLRGDFRIATEELRLQKNEAGDILKTGWPRGCDVEGILVIQGMV